MPEIEQGLCVRTGLQCYLCEQPIQTGQIVVLYHDVRFWEQSFIYHAGCWAEADLDAKDYAPEVMVEAPALEVPAVSCGSCGQLIAGGEMAVKVRAAGRLRAPRYYHERCHAGRPAPAR